MLFTDYVMAKTTLTMCSLSPIPSTCVPLAGRQSTLSKPSMQPSAFATRTALVGLGTGLGSLTVPTHARLTLPGSSAPYFVICTR